MLGTLVVIVIVTGLTIAAPFTEPVARAAECTNSVGPGIPPPTSVPSGVHWYHASWYGQSGYPTLCPGATSTATVAYYNSGSEGWYGGQMFRMAFLGTWKPEPGQDQPSPLGGDGTNGSPATGGLATTGSRRSRSRMSGQARSPGSSSRCVRRRRPASTASTSAP